MSDKSFNDYQIISNIFKISNESVNHYFRTAQVATSTTAFCRLKIALSPSENRLLRPCLHNFLSAPFPLPFPAFRFK